MQLEKQQSYTSWNLEKLSPLFPQLVTYSYHFFFINFSILKCHDSSVAIHQNSVNMSDEMLFFYWHCEVWKNIQRRKNNRSITCNLWKWFIIQVSMWRPLNTKTSVSLYGTLVVRTKFDLYGDTISRILTYVLNFFLKFKSYKN